MKLSKPLTLTNVLIFLFCSCHNKEVFPDLAKQMEGVHPVSEVTLLYYPPHAWNTGLYNPADSAQVGQITIRKIDALSVNVELLLKKQTGEILFEDTFDCELSRDIDNKGWIKFDTYGGSAGAYVMNNGSTGNNYLSLGSRTQHGHQVSNVSASFNARF